MRNLARIMVVCAGLLAGGCSTGMRITPGQIPPAPPIGTDLKGEAENFVQAHLHEESYKEIKSGKELARVKQIVSKLAVAAGYGPNTFPVHLVDAGDMVNAAAFNGASIVVYRELLNKVKSDDELATVLGHEVGHILAAHYKDAEEEQDRATAVGVGSAVLGIAASVATSVAGFGGVSGIAGDVTEGASGAIGYGAFVGSFSRTQEYEADHLGILLMAKAGYNPEVAIQFWSRAEEVFGSDDSTASAFFSTHPASGDRVDELREALPHAEKLKPAGK